MQVDQSFLVSPNPEKKNLEESGKIIFFKKPENFKINFVLQKKYYSFSFAN